MLRRVGSAAAAAGGLALAGIVAPAVHANDAVGWFREALVLDERAEGCLEREALAAALEHGLGPGAKAPPDHVRIVITENGRRITYGWSPGGPPTNAQTIHFPEVTGCAERVDNLGANLTLLVTELALQSPPPPAPAAPAEPSSPPPRRQVMVPTRAPRAAVPAEPARPTPSTTAHPAASLAMYGMALVGVLPEPAAGLAGAVDARIISWFGLAASVLAGPNVATEVGGRAATVSLAAGRLDGCGAVPLSSVALRGCLGVLAGWMEAGGEGFAAARSGNAPWVGAAARVEGRWLPLRAFGLAVAVDAIVPVVRPELRIDPDVVAATQAGTASTVRELPSVGVAVGAGPVVAFW